MFELNVNVKFGSVSVDGPAPVTGKPGSSCFLVLAGHINSAAVDSKIKMTNESNVRQSMHSLVLTAATEVEEQR